MPRMIHIDVISDTVCPWCYIGKRRLDRAIAARPDDRFEVEWRPFQLNPDMPPAGMDRQQYLSLKFGGPDRARRVYQSVAQAAAEEGLYLRLDSVARQPNTFDSHRLIRWSASAKAQDRVVELLFQRYFEDGADIGDREVLLAIAAAAGMDADLVRDLFERDADRDLVMAEEGVARRMGIAGVPCFIIERKYAVSGAQEPSVLANVFDLVAREREAGADAGAGVVAPA